MWYLQMQNDDERNSFYVLFHFSTETVGSTHSITYSLKILFDTVRHNS